MSRVGKNPVVIPSGVAVSLENNVIKAKGKLGELSFAYDPAQVSVTVEDGKVAVKNLAETKKSIAFWGTTRAQIASLVKGVSEGFKKEMEMIGVGYKARVQGSELIMSLGFSHEIVFKTPQGIAIACPAPTQIVVSGADKQLVGQTAAEIRKYRSPEPYKGKGVRYAGEFVRRKEGKKK